MALWRGLRVHQIFGANTDVGKTICGTLLCRAALVDGRSPSYLKPLGTAEPARLGDEGCVMQREMYVGGSCTLLTRR